MNYRAYILFAILVASCGDPHPIKQCDTIPLCPYTEATAADVLTLGRVTAAYLEVQGWVPCVCAHFCYEYESCVTAGLPPSWKEGRTDGLCRGVAPPGRAVVRSYGDAAPYTESLLIHEIAHGAGYSHGDPMKEFERQIREALI